MIYKIIFEETEKKIDQINFFKNHIKLKYFNWNDVWNENIETSFIS